MYYVMYRNPAGFIHPHGMLHGLLTVDEIDRGSMIITSKVIIHSVYDIDLLPSTKWSSL